MMAQEQKAFATITEGLSSSYGGSCHMISTCTQTHREKTSKWKKLIKAIKYIMSDVVIGNKNAWSLFLSLTFTDESTDLGMVRHAITLSIDHRHCSKMWPQKREGLGM